MQSAESILNHLRGHLTPSERKTTLENLAKSPATLMLLIQAEPLWRISMLKLEIEIEKTKEFIRIYSAWCKGHLPENNGPEKQVLCQKLDNFLSILTNDPDSKTCKTLIQELSAVFSHVEIQCFIQKINLLTQLESNLNIEKEAALLTLKLLIELKPELFSEKPNSTSEKKPMGFFAVKAKPEGAEEMEECVPDCP